MRTFAEMLHASLLALSLCALLPSVVVAAPAPAAKGGLEMHAGHQLTGGNFKESVGDGIWLVEHYSPWCHHCKAFAPTWIELVESRKSQEESINFHFGQVDCSVQGDLCDANDVKGYPSVFLYENGEFVESFKKERTLERLNKWLDDRLPDEPSSSTSSSTTGSDASGTEDEDAVKPLAAQAVKAVLEQKGTETTSDIVNHSPAPVAETTSNVAAGTHSHITGNVGAKITHPASGTTRLEEAPVTATATAATVRDTKSEEPIFQIQQHHVVQKRVTPNTEGKVRSVSSAELSSLLSKDSEQGPVFVKYFAPWCTHCKHLAPTWSDLASVLKNKVNVVEFNCDEADKKDKCRQEGVQGYPTLIFYNSGERAEYRGSRGLSQMEAFAAKAALATGLRDMSPYELTTIAEEEDVFFLYLYPSNTPESEVNLVHTAARTLVGSAPVYKSSSSDLFAQFRYPQTSPYLVVFKDHDNHPAQSLNFTIPRSTSTSNTSADLTEGRKRTEAEISSWLHGNKYPTLSELGSTNFNDYMEEGQLKAPSYIVLAGISKTRLGESDFEDRKENLGKIAKAWREGLRFKPRIKPVNFVWVDSDTWSKHLSSTYGVKPFDKEPTVIITDPSKDAYYPLDIEGHKLRIDGRQLFAALENIYDGKLKPKLSISSLERFGRWLGQYLGWILVAFGKHPVLATIFCVVLFVCMFSVLVYLMDSDEATYQAIRNGSPPVHQPKYVESKNSLYGGSNGSNGVKKD